MSVLDGNDTRQRVLPRLQPSSFDAFGHPVSTERQVAALDTAVEVFGQSALVADPVIQEAARFIEKDMPHEALLTLRNIADWTGSYRLMAVLCTDSSC